MVPLHLLNSNDPRHDLSRYALIPNITPILNCLEYLACVLNLVLDTLKFTIEICPNEYISNTIS